MFSFIKKFTDYGPKSFKGKTVKEILAMTPSKVPDDFFEDTYTQANLKEFEEADLSEEQENAIDLLRDLKNKAEIIRKCYDKRKKRAQQAPKQAQAQAQAEQAPAQAEQTQEEPAPAQAQAQAEQTQEEPEQQIQEQQEQSQEDVIVSQDDQKPLIGGGRRTKKSKRSKNKRSKNKKHKSSKSRKSGKSGKSRKRVKFSL